MEYDIEYENTVERRLFAMAYERLVPVYGVLELTPLCNMNCDMCYVRLSRSEMEAQGRMKTLDEWLMLAKEMKEAGVLFILLTGGEPLLYPWFKELYISLLEMGMVLTVNTNGTLIDEEWTGFFSHHKPRRINITLYGDSEAGYERLCHYGQGFDKAVKAIEGLRKAGVHVKINGSMTRANVSCSDGILDIGERLDVPVRIDTYMCPGVRERSRPFAFQTRMDPDMAAKTRIHVLRREMGDEIFKASCHHEFEKIKNTPEGKDKPYRMGCKAGRCSFTISWQGLMRPCVVMSEPSEDVFEIGFKKAWENITEKTKQIMGSSKCSKCHLRKYCNTCPAYALLEEGRYDAVPRYLCQYTEHSLEYMKKELEKIGDE